MTTDNEGVQGIDNLLDEIPDETPAAVEPAAEPAAEQVAEEPKQPETPAEPTETPVKLEQETPEPEELIEEAESQVAKLFDTPAKVDHSGSTVPVDKHIALRKRAQEAEAERDALKAQQANVDLSDALADLAALVEEGEDAYVETSKFKQVLEKLPGAINNIAQANINKVVEQANTQNLMSKIKADEIAFRKDHADYQAVTDFALSRNLVSDAEKQQVFASPNVAEAMYNLATEKINQERAILGVTTPSPAQPTIENQPEGPTETEVGDETLSDEQLSEYFLNPNS